MNDWRLRSEVELMDIKMKIEIYWISIAGREFGYIRTDSRKDMIET